MFVVIWEYEVRPGADAAFQALYGPDGDWAALFDAYPGFLDTELLRGEQPQHYLTIDRWASATEYAGFLEADRARYAQIDALGDTLTFAERCIGRYETPC